jgi:hypothetical protein
MALRQLAAPFDSYDELIGVIRHRLAELQVTCESASALAGLSETHLSKIVCPARVRVLGRMSLTVVLQTLGIRLIAVTDDAAHARLAARLPKAVFRRWKPRELGVRVDDVGGVAAVEKVPALLAAVTVPIVERPKPKPEPQSPVTRPVYDPDEPHPLPVRSRPRFGRGHGFGRAQRSASAA